MKRETTGIGAGTPPPQTRSIDRSPEAALRSNTIPSPLAEKDHTNAIPSPLAGEGQGEGE